jgi:hypothetical protein
MYRLASRALALSLALALGGASLAAAQAQAPAPTSDAPPGTTVKPVTVQPKTTPKPKVVAGGDAASPTSPNYTAEDARDPPRAVSLGDKTAAGVQSVMPTQPPGGLPASIDPGPKRSDLGVTTVF